MNVATKLAPILLCALLAACGQSAIRDEPASLDEHLARLGYQRGEAVETLSHHAIDGWQYLDKEHMILGHGRAHLITFSRPCHNLRFSNAIGYTSTAGLLTRLDRIVSTAAGGFPEHCQIGEIHRLEPVGKTLE